MTGGSSLEGSGESLRGKDFRQQQGSRAITAQGRPREARQSQQTSPAGTRPDVGPTWQVCRTGWLGLSMGRYLQMNLGVQAERHTSVLEAQ